MARMNISRGITPDAGERIAVFGDWSLYQTADANGWLALKLVCDGGAKLAKANYHLSWNGERLAGSSDAARLDVDWPMLSGEVQMFLSSRSPVSRASA